jgi:hypothetical protein
MISLRLLVSLFLFRAEHLWSDWIPLQENWNVFPSSGGLYRIRLDFEEQWLYLGQTSHLRNRLKMLKNAFRDEMPYAAPHTAGPALYAYRHLYPDATLEASFCVLDIPEQTRLAMESLAIALHRQTYQQSPRAQFGRMPTGWKASSGNSAQLVTRGQRFRGGPIDYADESHLPDIAPAGPLTNGAVGNTTWLNLSWSEWVPCAVASTICGSSEGIYCISATEQGSELLFIGQGKIVQRVAAYKKRPVFCAWAVGAWYPHQRLAMVTDLVASYVLQTGKIPREQFIAAQQPKTIVAEKRYRRPAGSALCAPCSLDARTPLDPNAALSARRVVVPARGHSQLRCVHLPEAL